MNCPVGMSDSKGGVFQKLTSSSCVPGAKVNGPQGILCAKYFFLKGVDFPMVAVTNDHKFSGLNNVYFLKVLGLGVGHGHMGLNPGVRRAGPTGGSRENGLLQLMEVPHAGSWPLLHPLPPDTHPPASSYEERTL